MDTLSHDPFLSAEADDAGSNRSKTRDSLFLMAGVRVAGAAEFRSVRVRNLSAGGLMAELPDALEIGTPVEIDVRGIGMVPGKVAWSAAGRIGVSFDRQIDPMAARKPVGAPPRRSSGNTPFRA